MTQHERFVREVLWPNLLTSKQGMTRKEIERIAPGIHCSGFISHLLSKDHGKPILDEVGEKDGNNLLHLTRYWKKQLSTVDGAVDLVADRVHKYNNAYYADPESKKRRKKNKKKKEREKRKLVTQQVVVSGPKVDLAAVISGKPSPVMINAMKAEVLDLLLKGPGVREAILQKLKLKAFAWER
jgi:hypothetical protein